MKTLIAVPCHDMVHAEFAESMLRLDIPDGCKFVMVRNTLIYTARDLIARNAVKEGFDRVMWIDSDMVLPADTLVRLSQDMDTGIDYVSGLYFARTLPISPVIYSDIRWNVNDDGWVQTGADKYENYPEGLFEIAGSGFGCVMTSAELLKKTTDAYGSPFSPLMGIGEDLTFCWRVKKLGLKMYCDSRIKCGHVGRMIYNEEKWKEGQAK